MLTRNKCLNQNKRQVIQDSNGCVKFEIDEQSCIYYNVKRFWANPFYLRLPNNYLNDVNILTIVRNLDSEWIKECIFIFYYDLCFLFIFVLLKTFSILP